MGRREFGHRSYYWYARNGLRSVVNHVTTQKLSHVDVRPPVIMSFVRRSGSTWVTQMVSNLPNVVCVSDPLLERNAWLAARMTGFHLRSMYFFEDQIAPAEDFLRDCLSFRARYSTLEGLEGLAPAAPVNPFVKIANTPWLMPWFAREFDAKTRILVRHPIDIVRSQLQHWNMPPYLASAVPELERRGALTSEEAAFCRRALEEGDAFSQRMIEVVLEYRPLWQAGAEPIKTISYERLRAGDLSELSFLSDWSPDWEEHLKRGYSVKSKTTESRNSLSGAAPHTQSERDCLSSTLDAFGAQKLATFLDFT